MKLDPRASVEAVLQRTTPTNPRQTPFGPDTQLLTSPRALRACPRRRDSRHRGGRVGAREDTWPALRPRRRRWGGRLRRVVRVDCRGVPPLRRRGARRRPYSVRAGMGGERLSETRPYQFGDNLSDHHRGGGSRGLRAGAPVVGRDRADGGHQPQHDPLRRGSHHARQEGRARALAGDPDPLSARHPRRGAVRRRGDPGVVATS